MVCVAMKWVWSICLVLLAVSVVALTRFPGDSLTFAAFDIAFLVVMLLVWPRPRLYAYTFLAFLLFLGFWLKLMLHLILGYHFIEPVGLFVGSATQWDRALDLASAGALGVAAVRALHLVWARRTGQTEFSPHMQPPSWFRAHRGLAWSSTAILVLGLNAANVAFAFYQDGVDTRLTLPLHLNVAVAWALTMGLAVWLALLVGWETELCPTRWERAVSVAWLAGFVATVSELSRAVFLFHAVPYAVGFLHPGLRLSLTRARLVRLGTLFAACFLVGLVIVTLIRSTTYIQASTPVHHPTATVPGAATLPSGGAAIATGGAPTPATAAPAPNLPVAFRKLLYLVSDRWVGLEGVLAVASYPGTGPRLLARALGENPRTGVHGLYQRIARATYPNSPRFTFLTLAGAVAVWGYAGSPLVVFLGMIALTLAVLATESVLAARVGNPFVAAFAGLEMAFTVTEITYPYLAAVFFVEMWLTLAVAARLGATGASPLQPRGTQVRKGIAG